MKFKIVENVADQLKYILNIKNRIPNAKINNSKFSYKTTDELIQDLEKLGNQRFRLKNRNAVSTQNGIRTLTRIIQSARKD